MQKTMKKDGSAILSQRDLSAYFDPQKFRRNSSSVFNKSDCSSPTSSTSSKHEPSQNETGTQNLEQEILRLNDILSLQRARTEAITTENATLANQLHVQDSLIAELKNEKQKLVEELHYIRKGYEQVQDERNRLLIETGKLRNKINVMQATLDINEEQLSSLEHNNRILVDQLNFEKEMLADYKQQNSYFKAQLKNIMTAFISLKDSILEERENCLKENKLHIDTKIAEIKAKLDNYKGEIRDLEASQWELMGHKNEIFSIVRRIELNFDSTRTQLNIAKSLSTSFDEGEASAFLARESQFRKTIQSQQSTIKTLSTQITALKKANSELSDQLASASHIQLLAPRFHTNTTYVNKLVKQNHREIQQIKQLIEIKDQQISRLHQQISLEQSTSELKSEQIQRLQLKLKVQQNNSYTELNNQIEELKAEKLRLNRRVEQMGQLQHGLKAEILEKDRIIMTYVQKTKEK